MPETKKSTLNLVVLLSFDTCVSIPPESISGDTAYWLLAFGEKLTSNVMNQEIVETVGEGKQFLICDSMP